jgi:hypothetical protein
MSLEFIIEQEVTKIGAILKKDAVHLVAFPLEPVRPFP